MLKRFFLFLVGFGFTVIGFTFIITYLNLTTMGYSVLDYIKFIIKRFECVMCLIGIIFINFSKITCGIFKNRYITNPFVRYRVIVTVINIYHGCKLYRKQFAIV